MDKRRTAIAPAITELERLELEVHTRQAILRPCARKRGGSNYHFCGRPRKCKQFTKEEIQVYQLHKLWNAVDWTTLTGERSEQST